jgi:hypothetical protein
MRAGSSSSFSSGVGLRALVSLLAVSVARGQTLPVCNPNGDAPGCNQPLALCSDPTVAAICRVKCGTCQLTAAPTLAPTTPTAVPTLAPTRAPTSEPTPLPCSPDPPSCAPLSFANCSNTTIFSVCRELCGSCETLSPTTRPPTFAPTRAPFPPCETEAPTCPLLNATLVRLPTWPHTHCCHEYHRLSI